MLEFHAVSAYNFVEFKISYRPLYIKHIVRLHHVKGYGVLVNMSISTDLSTQRHCTRGNGHSVLAVLFALLNLCQ